MTVYGYARVSTIEQNTGRQIIALENAGVPKDNIFVDKLSGKNFERPQYQALKERLTAGDTLYIKSIDRLGRNYADLQEEWAFITKQIGADIVCLDMPLLDTRQGKDLIGTFVADLILQVLAFVSQQEREFIRQRQREGIEAAKAKGIHIGRQANPLPDNFEEVYLAYKMKEISQTDAARILGMPLSTFRNRLRQHEGMN